MYTIYADGVCIYNDAYALENMRVVGPRLVLQENTAGSLTLTLPPSNLGYESIVRMASDISVFRDGTELWAGRVLSESKDFYNNRVLQCEGELAFLNDSTQPPAEYPSQGVRAFLEALLGVHNAKVPENRRFSVGAVTVDDPASPLPRHTNYEKTIESVNSLLDELGGYLRIRKVAGVRYLDYLAEYPRVSGQAIEFGKNLFDFTRKWDATEFATVILPLGRQEEAGVSELGAYLTVESVNDGSPYVCSQEALATYGWIEKVVHWDDEEDAESLLAKAQAYLADVQFDDVCIELSALDLHYLSVEHDDIRLLDELRVISRPHGMDRYFPVTKLDIPLDSPDNSRFTLGDTVVLSLTVANNQSSSAILKKIESLPKAQTILNQAVENATQIMNMATNGYITLTKDTQGTDALYITNDRDYSRAEKLWKWSINGLGYSNNGGRTFGLAITMDGAIVADYITTGTLNADLIRTGKLQDPNGNTVFNLADGSLTVKKGAINLGSGRFSVDSSGYLTSIRGKIGGFDIANDGIVNSMMALSSDGLLFKVSDRVAGSFSSGYMGHDPSQIGMTMRLRRDANYLAWSVEREDGGYNIVMSYSNRETVGLSSANRIGFYRDIDARNNCAYRLVLDPNTCVVRGAASIQFRFALPAVIDNTGTITRFWPDCFVKIQNGFVVDLDIG